MSARLGLLFLSFLISAVSAQALQVPYSFTNGQSGLYRQTLGASCYGIDINSDSVPCNPAYMAKERLTEFKLQVFGGNNISYLSKATDIARGDASREELRGLFTERSSSELQAAGSAVFMTEKFSLTYEPYSVRLQSEIRNPVLPELTIYGTLDDTFSTQLATYMSEDFYFGLQIRYLRRQSVAARFFLTDLAAENGARILNPEDKSFIYLEPGFLYSPLGYSWRPEISLTFMNGGILNNGGRSSTDPIPEVNLAGSISPEVGLGRWGLSLNTQWSSALVDTAEMFTLGSYYEMGILTILGSFAQNTQGLGFNVRFNNLNLGLSFVNKTEKLDNTETWHTRQVLLLLGFEL